jgi:hypothetical protein
MTPSIGKWGEKQAFSHTTCSAVIGARSASGSWVAKALSGFFCSPFPGSGEEAECAPGPDDRGAISAQQPGVPPFPEEAAPCAKVHL